MARAWINAVIEKRRSRRHSFGGRSRTDGTEEYIIKVPGFSGELRKYMSEKEASEYVAKTNKAAFVSAAEASSHGIHGYEEFSKHGSAKGTDMFRLMSRTAARGFGVRKPKEKPENKKGK